MDSGLTDFFQQIPQGFILMFCGSAVLLIFVVGYIVRERGKRANAAVPPVVAAPDYAESSADLPDLDLFPVAEAVAPRARPAGAHAVDLVGGESVEVVEVLSVLRDVGEGSLIIRIGDKAYRNPPAHADAEFKRRLHNTLRDLNGAVSVSPSSAPGAESISPSPEETSAAKSYAAPVSAPPVTPKPASTARFSSAEPAPGDLPKFRMPDGPPVKPKRGQRPAKEPIPEINIAGSIEAFLQHKLVRTPQYDSRSIHVVPASHGGVKIEVDGVYFESVAEVEDVEVRSFLTATIEEWQARQ
jgi:hypothetical protein